MHKGIRGAFSAFFSSFKRKMIMITVIILMIIMLLVEIGIYSVDIPVQMNNAIDNHSREVQYISERLDAAITNYDWFLNSLTMNEELQLLLEKSYENSLEESLINFDMEMILKSVTILSNNKFENIFLYDTRKIRGFQLNNADFDKRFLELDGLRYRNEGNVQWIAEGDKVYIHRAILDRRTFRLIGYITMSVHDDYLKGLMRSAAKGYTFIFNESNHLVIQDQDKQMDTNVILAKSKTLKKGESAVISIEPQGDMLLTKYKSQFSLWTTVSLIPLSVITAGADQMAKWIITIGVIGILLGIFIIWISSNRLIHPLKELSRVMKQVEQDNFSARVEIRGNDEFGRLSLSFNHMMRKIDTLISEVYQKEISQKEAENKALKAEYKALKAQINPHFIYNTLETIRSLSEFDEPDKVSMVTVSLGKLLKASISNQKDFIPVREELEYIDAYLAIQNTRFENKVDVSIQVNESILSYFIPRFILQPLVENAFVHGLENKIDNGNLIIKASLDRQNIIFQIIDDGVGIDPERISDILTINHQAGTHSKGTGNGLLNVSKRLSILYGDPFGMSIQSSPNFGTIIELKVPIQQDQGGEFHVPSGRY